MMSGSADFLNCCSVELQSVTRFHNEPIVGYAISGPHHVLFTFSTTDFAFTQLQAVCAVLLSHV